MLRKAIAQVDDPFWKEIKQKEVDQLIKAVSGLYVELTASQNTYVPGDSIQLSLEAINRGSVPMKLTSVKLNLWNNPIELQSPLINNKKFGTTMNLVLPGNIYYTTPYWLREEATLGMYAVPDQEQRGKPENDPAIVGDVKIEIGEEVINYVLPVVFKKNDPVQGEVYEPVAISPPVMANISGKVLVFGDENSKTVEVRVIAEKEGVEGTLTLNAPDGWKISPSNQPFDLSQKGQEKIYTFEVTPPAKRSEGALTVELSFEGDVYNKGVTAINYDHIPRQTIYPNSEIRLIKLDLNKKGNLIAYIDGAGDAIPDNLAQIGYQVDWLTKDEVNAENLSKYDALILGVRAFNTVDWLAYKNEELFKYAENGGTVIVQYNTSHRLVTKKIAPYTIRLSRDRVAVEEAPVEILAKEHAVIKGPNKITNADFDNWAQERGLYFPNEWSEEFTPILSSNDPGESPKNGGLLIAKHGKGYYVYSGYSWFRNLPAGVPGAYRLFVNLISLGK
ncbi:MAG: LmbE family protein, partial [Bacteroidota bacterium]